MNNLHQLDNTLVTPFSALSAEGVKSEDTEMRGGGGLLAIRK
jgi:hypothetical protein